MTEKRTLLLNSWYLPIKILRWEDAVKMKYEKTVDIVAEYDEEIRSPSVTWLTPAVVRLRRPIKGTKRGVKFSRVNVYTRDHYTCQYCGKRHAPEELSYDHVVPRSSGGKTCWTNIVTACRKCNARKDDKTCDESGMFPLNLPVRPRSLPLTVPLVRVENAPPEWLPFLQNQPGFVPA